MVENARRRSIPATPQSDPGLFGFLEALRQNILRLSDEMLGVQEITDKAVVYDLESAPDRGVITTGVLTITARDGAFQKIINNGAHTLQPPSENCVIVLLYRNGPAAGAITITGFTKVTGTAAPPSNGTTNGHEFFARITVIENFSLLEWVPLQ